MRIKNILIKMLLFVFGVLLCVPFFLFAQKYMADLLLENVMDYLYPFESYSKGEKKDEFTSDMGFMIPQEYFGMIKFMEEYPNDYIQIEDMEMVKSVLRAEGCEESVIRDEWDDEGEEYGQIDGEDAQEKVDEEWEDVEEEKNIKEQQNSQGKNSVSMNEEENIQSTVSENESRFMKEENLLFKAKVSEEAFQKYIESLHNYETLKKEFYQINHNTYVKEEELNAESLLGVDLSLKTDASLPQILIYHTHSQEAFADSREGKVEDTVMGAGELLAEELRGYGFHVIHHTGMYDVNQRDYAYSLAGPAIEEVLKENPSIEVVIDLHRDGVAEETKLTKEIDGVKMAQFMFFNGLSRTNTTGDIGYLENPYIKENLAFSFQMQLQAYKYYPGLARKIYLKGYRYNMHFRGKSLLVELGAQTNTVEEVKNAIPPLAFLLYQVLKPQ